MTSLRTVAPSQGLRARRWDVIVLGSGLAGLVAAARLGIAGQRVLVVEEAGVRGAFPGLREPFFLAGARDGGLLEACLRGLKLPLIDRRRIQAERLAYQLVGPDLRLDVGGPSLSAEELVAWRLADIDSAHALVRAVVEASAAERRFMLEAPLVRIGRRVGLPRPPVGSHVRGIPAEAAEAPEAVTRLLVAQAQALSNLASSPPSPEARARLLGSALAGGAGFADGPPWLAGLLRRRVESLFGEFRYAAGEFSLVEVGGQPGVAIGKSGELWVGNALLLAAPYSGLCEAVDEFPTSLGKPPSGRRRVAIHLRAQRNVLPESLARRAILTGEQASDGGTPPLTMLSLFEGEGDGVDLVARRLLRDGESAESLGDEIEAQVRAILPFSKKGVSRRQVVAPVWDTDDLLEDPEPGGGWPGEIDMRVSSKPPVYRLDRRAVAGLGTEGDLLLGWRGGDALAADLA